MMPPQCFDIIPPQPCPAGFALAPIADRLPAFDAMACDAPARLASAVASVIGVGSVGRVIAEQLSRIGVGTVQLIDRGVIKPQSMLTHAGVMPEDIGQPKARSAGILCKRINPNVNVQVFDGDIEDLPPTALLSSDFALLASDNLKAEVYVSQLFASLGKPLVQLSVDGPTLVTQARVLSNRPGGPCLRCLFGAAEEQHLHSDHRFPCDGSAAPAIPRTQPTMSTANLCALAASIGVTLFIRHALGLGEPLHDSLHEFCGYTFETSISPIRRRSDCPQLHEPWRIVRIAEPLPNCTLRRLAAACDLSFAYPLQVEIDNFTYVTAGAEGRFVCPGELGVPLVHVRKRVPAEMLADRADRAIESFVSASPRWAMLHDEQHTWLVVGVTK